MYGLEDVEIISEKTPAEFLKQMIDAQPIVECHSVVDLGSVIRQFQNWKQLLPRVHPYYAIKSFPNINVIRVMHLLGVNFDCASAGEIRACLGVGANPSDIIYANPAKGFKHIEYAKEQGVNRMTFDNKEELHKVKQIFPNVQLVLRIAANDLTSVMPFGYKFGCSFEYAVELIDCCKEEGMQLIGISFHVGSGCYNPQAYVDTLKTAKRLFDYAESVGIQFQFLDLGGGWPGDKEGMQLFHLIADAINPVLEELFPPSVQIIAEPGRYFAMSTTTIAVQIHSKRDYFGAAKKVELEDGTVETIPAEREVQYYLTEGAYGSFNNTVWDFQKVLPVSYKEIPKDAPLHKTTFFGPTCDSLDVVAKQIPYPEMNVGDWVYFSNMGAYTTAAASNFNGFECPAVYYKIFT
jgi:ornithine decarboxylase